MKRYAQAERRLQITISTSHPASTSILQILADRLGHPVQYKERKEGGLSSAGGSRAGEESAYKKIIVF